MNEISYFWTRVFKRIDLASNNIVYPNFSNVSNTSLNTTIENEFGVKVSTITLRAFGISIFGINFLTPKANCMEPLIYSNLGTSVSEKDRMRTKNAINKVAISAKVAIQGGEPFLHSGQS